jgi:hypothetical protein
MNQQRNNKVVVVILGAILLLASLPSEWMTIRNATLNFPGASVPGAGGLTFTVTGFNGHITWGAKLPIWFIVSLGLVSLLMILLNRIKATSLPTWVILAPGIISAAFSCVGIFIGATSEQTSLGMGGFLAIAGLICGALAHFGSLKGNDELGAPANGSPTPPAGNSGVSQAPPSAS